MRQVWDIAKLECIDTLKGHSGPVRTLVYSGGRMFSGSYDKTVRVWDVETLKCLATLQGAAGRFGFCHGDLEPSLDAAALAATWRSPLEAVSPATVPGSPRSFQAAAVWARKGWRWRCKAQDCRWLGSA